MDPERLDRWLELLEASPRANNLGVAPSKREALLVKINEHYGELVTLGNTSQQGAASARALVRHLREWRSSNQ